MKQNLLSRRNVLLGAGSFVLGAATAGVVGVTFREEVKRLLGFNRPTTGRVVQAAAADDGWLLTEDDRRAFEAADRVASSEVLVLRDAVDIPGGDYESFRAESLQACVSACEAQSECDAFTYASASHGTESKRRMCWLKKGQASSPVTGATHYVSGRRSGW